MKNKPPTNPIVFIVDDDDAVRESLCWLIESVGLNALPFASATDFLQSYAELEDSSLNACLVSDIRMKNMSGLELQVQLRNRGNPLPIIFMSGYGDVSMAVQAMKAGAVDFFTKPVNDQALLECIQRTLSHVIEFESNRIELNQIRTRVSSLTPREKAVLDKVVEGKLNKIIAVELNVSSKTVEAHRAKVMDKMSVRTVADLVRMVIKIE